MGLEICHIILIESNNNSIDYLFIDDFSNNKKFLEKHKHKIVDRHGDKIIFYKDLGYIRKQAKPMFINEFENDKLYFTKSDVEKWFKYLKSNGNQQQLEIYFRKNFLDNFIEGESIFFISY